MPRDSWLILALLVALASRAWGAPVDASAAADSPRAAAPDEAAQREFFERRVRPVLVENCQGCHGAEKQKGGLRVDSRAALLAGGDSGAAVVPGKPDEGYLVSAVNYGELYQMPPKGKLKPGEIEALTQWVRDGAYWPAEAATAGAGKPTGEINWAERADFWSFKPIGRFEPPAVRNAAWCATPIDRFVLTRLEQAGLSTASDAERSAWLRRVTFALTGLPPTVAEVEAFAADTSPQAYEHVVDRLLASPRYGERFARHWLDLARYAETYGHEFDFDIPHAWRYRDYVIRALNADLPYDQFIREQVAGDLLPEPRRLADGANESIRGTGFFWFGEQTHSPVDLWQAEAERIDNQIDVLSKTFLGLTVACARCHDHKFDALRASDYYALFGILRSSRFSQVDTCAPAKNEKLLAELAGLKPALRVAVAEAVRPQFEQLDRALLDAVRAEQSAAASPAGAIPPAPGEWRWQFSEARSADHPLYPWAALLKENKPIDEAALATVWKVFTKPTPPGDLKDNIELLDWHRPLPTGWKVYGSAFAAGPSRPGDFQLGNLASQPITAVSPRLTLNTASASKRLQGSLQTPDFTIERDKIHVLVAGWQTRVRLVVDGFELIRSPIYGGLTRPIATDKPRWMTFDVKMWRGHRAYFEFQDIAPQDPADPLPSATTIALYGKVLAADVPLENIYGGVGWLSLERIVQSDHAAPPLRTTVADLLGSEPPRSLEELATRYRTAALAALDAWRRDVLDDSTQIAAQGALLDWLLSQTPAGKLTESPTAAAANVQKLWQSYRAREAELKRPQFALAMTEGTPADAPIYIRGNPKSRGPRAERRFIQAISQDTPANTRQSSGRLFLAEQLTDTYNPLVARVIVNRLWRWMYGEGLARTPDDFGHMGQSPSHAELLDWLAHDFMAHGWSIKRALRQIALSHTYRLSSTPNAKSLAADPDNRLWHHVPVKRLEAESIRDALLVISGRLDSTMYGPSVAAHLNDFMIGRGRPSSSGPLDGAGRRSIYLAVRRNFLNPMFLAFDAPQPFSTVGRRSVSHVPAQALAMMNNPLVIDQAERWARRALTDEPSDPARRVNQMYLAAFARPATPDELQAALEFVAANSTPSGGPQDAAVWGDLAHALLNASEFVFVP
ncbi:MAG: PSD1 domain-containing protein [Planctomycetes bacterium]|nr:PSD1 domain-containing protein [Planctomycetota bacterium]